MISRFPFFAICADIKLTGSKADFFSSLYLRTRKRYTIDLHARDPSTEVPHVAWQCTHSDGSVGGKANASNIHGLYRSRILPECCNSRLLVVRCSNVIPLLRYQPAAYELPCWSPCAANKSRE